MKNMRNALIVLMLLLMPFTFAKRTAPPMVAPVFHNGLEFKASPDQIEWTGSSMKVFISVVRESTGRHLRSIPVYEVLFDPALEKDVQHVYISSMSLDGENNRLVIINEAGDTFFLDLHSFRTWKVIDKRKLD